VAQAPRPRGAQCRAGARAGAAAAGCPMSFRDLAWRWRVTTAMYRIAELRDATVLETLEALDAFRRPERIELRAGLPRPISAAAPATSQRDYPQGRAVARRVRGRARQSTPPPRSPASPARPPARRSAARASRPSAGRGPRNSRIGRASTLKSTSAARRKERKDAKTQRRKDAKKKQIDCLLRVFAPLRQVLASYRPRQGENSHAAVLHDSFGYVDTPGSRRA